MKEQFLTYEQSKEIRELGFNEPCLARYCGEEYFIIEDPDDRHSLTKEQCSYFLEFYFLAPTYQQAFDFIREKFGYNFYIRELIKDRYTFFIEKWELKYYENDFRIPYEEARARGLDKLIEIINNDK